MTEHQVPLRDNSRWNNYSGDFMSHYINEASDTHPLHIKDEKLKDPNAAAIVNYLNGIDLKFSQKSITEGDRTLLMIVTNSVTKGKE